MGLGTLYGAEHSAMGLSTPLWGRGHSMGCSVVYWSILVYTGRRRPPPPVSLSVPLSNPQRGNGRKWGGGRQFWGKISAFWGFWGRTLGRKAAIWGQKAPFGGRSPQFGAKWAPFWGRSAPNLGQKV